MFVRSSKLILYNSVVRPVVTYASATCVLKKQIENELQTFETKILRLIFGHTIQPVGIRSRKTNEELKNLMKQKKIIVRRIKVQRLAWLGHVEKMQEGEVTKIT
jgi:hypothetical protein